MDPYSSGEDLVIKTRKPYTITKQRERWTEEEHNRFLEALKLHGRAWQRIEEHIGTKTAVQIRSHAQKFFTKLEKEAVVKGVPIGHALDIDIPPPRPKRKPSNPYPRKTNVVGVKDGKLSNSVSSSCQSKLTGALEKDPEKPCDDGKLGNCNDYWEKDDPSEAFTLLKTAPCASPSSANRTSLSVNDAPGKSCTYRQYVPLSKEQSNQDETAASMVTIEAKVLEADKSGNKKLFQNNAPFNISNVVNSYNISNEKSVHSTRTDVAKQSENVDTLPTSEVHQASQNYPRHVPVHILDGSLGVSAKTTSSPMESMFNQMSGVHGHQNVFMNPAASANSNASRPSVCQSFPSYQPIFTPIQNPDDYHSFLHLSSTFSSLILSALSQNPAAYAAATFASTLWPCVNNMEGPVEPFQSRPTSSTPSMAAIAAATVAAATAWWAAHGLLQVCAPFHPGFTGSPPGDENRNTERRENSPDPEGQQQLEPECSEALRDQQHSDSEASEGAKPNAAVETAKAVDTDDANKSKNKKQVDRSSCGSNTPSSSEVEGDALEKHTEGVEENHHMNDKDELEDPFNRRCRSSSTYTINDSWKEVSEEGRLAFQALFSREVLPQSFSPPHKDMKSCGVATRLQLDLNGMTWVGTSSQKQDNDSASLIVEENKEEEGLLSMGLGQAKLKARRTGFKPYKRCSMEAKESCRVSVNGQDEEKGAKRLRVEGEAST